MGRAVELLDPFPATFGALARAGSAWPMPGWSRPPARQHS